MSIRLTAAVVAFAVLFVFGASAQTPYVVTTLPLPANSTGSYPSRLTPVGNAIYFYSSQYNNYLWKWTEADGAKVVQTISSDYYGANAGPILAFNGNALFAAYVDSRGHELWTTDGTTTTLVKDIYVGGSSVPLFGAIAGGKVFFTAYQPDTGRELWVTDGTNAGTMIVKDITGDSASSSPTGLVEAGGKVYFHALGQLWVSDGTEAGTIVLASNVSNATPGVLNGEVFFLGADNDHGRELWSTDGTPGGTAMVKDINPGTASSWGGIPSAFVQANGVLFFFAEDATHGRELWKTDGTEAGTQLVKDIVAGANSTDVETLVASQAGAFFLVDKTKLWFSDGSDAGTIEAGSFPTGIASMVAATNGAFLVTKEPALYFSNGTVAGTIEIDNVTPSGIPWLAPNGASVIFSGTNGTNGLEPWISDGTEAGTEMLADVGAAPVSSPAWMEAADANVFLSHGSKLLRSDGTAPGTFEVGALTTNTSYNAPYPRAALGSTLLYFGGADDATLGLWKSNGTVAGTSRILEFKRIDRIVATSGGYALFVGKKTNEYNEPVELWRTDGTVAGTTKLLSVDAGHFVDIAGRTYFLAGYSYYEQWADLWRTDGTPETTRLVTKGNFGGTGTAGGALYLSHFVTASGRELWRSDGTADGMALVKDIKPGTGSSDPTSFASAGNILFFTADDGVHGRELWRSDGTEAGTFMLKDIRAGSTMTYISSLTARGKYVYFAADNGISGTDLWRSDGTIAGTIRLASTGTSADFDWLTPFDTRILLSGHDSVRGYELWESDGSVGGTFVFADLIAGPTSSTPRLLTLTRDFLFFVADAAKLWAVPRVATRVSIDDRRIIEGDAGSTLLQFTVTRTGNTSGSTNVTYATEDINAAAGTDYQGSSGSVTFLAGETTKQIAVPILGDTTLEANEFFAVNLTGATGGTIVDDRALGVIEENDRKVALSIEYLPRLSGYYYETGQRTFRITNNGASGATVTMKVSESPYEGTFTCDGKNPSTCSVGFVPAGQSVELKVYRNSSSTALTDPANIPGRTITATISALEAEDDLSDNTVSRMINNAGFVSLPAALVAGSSSTAKASSPTGYVPAVVQLSLTGGVVVSPATATVTEAEPIATFGLTIGSNAWGWSTVKSGNTTIMRVPIVMPGETAKLDTSIYVSASGYYGWDFDFDEAVIIPVKVAATLPDGTRPSGNLSLRRKSDDSLVQTLALDANGSATFNLGTLPVGLHEYRVAYAGDASFQPLTVEIPDVNVNGWATSTNVVVVDRPCGDAEIVVTVYNGDDHTPTGVVNIFVSGTQVATLPLVATDTPGQATAKMNWAFSGYSSVEARYVPNTPFEPSSDWGYRETSTCPAPTLIASAASATSVSLLWSDVGATLYEIVRAEGPSRTLFSVVGTTASTTFTDTTAVAGKSYLYKVNAKATGGVLRSTSNQDLATTVIFSDDPIIFRTTRIKAAHIAQLQQAAHAVRTLANLAPVTLTPPSTGMFIDDAYITALRTAITEALNVLGYPVAWVDGVGAGQAVKALHVQQIRNVVK